MQIPTDEQRRNLNMPSPGVIAPRPRFPRDLWIAVLDELVRILTFGRGRVVVPNRSAPIRWDGVIR